MLEPRLVALAFFALTLCAVPAHATVMREVPFAELVASADAVVMGTVVDTEVMTVAREQGLEPHTRSTLRVSEWVRGRRSEARVIIRELGGVGADVARWIDGTPRYRVGDEVVVFLVRHPEQRDEWRTLAMAQGRFAVERGAPGVPSVVRRDLAGLAFARWADGAMRVDDAAGDGDAIELDEFLAAVRRGAR